MGGTGLATAMGDWVSGARGRIAFLNYPFFATHDRLLDSLRGDPLLPGSSEIRAFAVPR
jgi:hypothetical protein